MCLVPGEARFSRDGMMLPFLEPQRSGGDPQLCPGCSLPLKTLKHEDHTTKRSVRRSHKVDHPSMQAPSDPRLGKFIFFYRTEAKKASISPGDKAKLAASPAGTRTSHEEGQMFRCLEHESAEIPLRTSQDPRRALC